MQRLFFIVFFFSLLIFRPVTAAELDYGVIIYTPGGGNVDIDMSAANGSITCNNANYFCPSFGTTGSVLITGTTGNQVDIACKKNTIVSNVTFDFNIRRSEIYMTGINVTACNGLSKNIVTHTITGSATADTVYWAGQLEIKGIGQSDIGGNYSSTIGGGDPQTIRLTFI